MGGKRIAKDYWTFDELAQKCKGKSEKEVAALHAEFNRQHNIDPADCYPPEEANRRFKTVLRAAMFIPPADDEERQLRQTINAEWAKLYDRGTTRK